MSSKCVCLICYKPNDIWIDFLSKFTNYDLYILIDDNSKDYKEQYSKFSQLTILQINNEESKSKGFIATDFKENGEGWSKALYYFSSICKDLKFVWFIEDDVFLNDESALLNIDSQYTDIDLLTSTVSENIQGKKDDWHWSWIEIKLPPPYYNAMCCASRMSNSILSKIKEYATKHNTLYFHEALSPTLCHFYKYSYKCPRELVNIIWRRTYEDKDIEENNLYHPVKDIPKHIYYREMLKNK
jgi:hypothetical protein